MKSKAFGLDIGATTIKVVWLSQEKEGFILSTALTYPAPQKGMLSESPFDHEEMARTIQKIIQNGKIDAKYVNIALPENQVYTRVIEMPVLSDKELASAIYWEAEQYISVPLNSVTLDWKILKKTNEQVGSKMEVLLVGAPTAIIDKYQKIVSMAGLSINSLESEILSAVRALMFLPKDSQAAPPTLIVHIGAQSTSMAIVSEGVLTFTYTTMTGGIALNRAIAADFGFSTSVAEEYKKTYGVSNEVFEGKIGKATEPVLLSIISEVKKAVTFYNDKHKDAPIRQLLLSGGTAKLPEIDLFFAKHAGIETIIANPWKVLASGQVPKDILDNAPDYTIAVGLALRDNG